MVPLLIATPFLSFFRQEAAHHNAIGFPLISVCSRQAHSGFPLSLCHAFQHVAQAVISLDIVCSSFYVVFMLIFAAQRHRRLPRVAAPPLVFLFCGTRWAWCGNIAEKRGKTALDWETLLALQSVRWYRRYAAAGALPPPCIPCGSSPPA